MRRSVALWRRWGGVRLLVAAAATLAVLALVEAGVRRDVGRAPGAEALWIWARIAEGHEQPVGFYAVRDFRLGVLPARATVRVVGDEEYHLLLNGELVGSRRHRDGEPAAAYQVADLLRLGANRLAVELRSGRGVGGFFLRLEGGERVLVGSDREWKIVRRFDPRLLEPGAGPVDGEPPRVWGEPPTGRWRLGDADPSPRFAATLLRPEPALARRFGLAGQRSSWQRLEGPVDWRSPPLGTELSFDWGETVTGQLHLVFSRTESGRGVFWAGDRPVRRSRWPPTGVFQKVPGSRSWSATEVRSLRYVTVWSDTELTGARVYLVDPAVPGVRVAGEIRPSGLLDLDPPRREWPAEQVTRAYLEEVASRDE